MVETDLHPRQVAGAVDGVIFDVKKFSVNDGPGIRTAVFFKGCPLRCLWCHNPESLSPRAQVVFDERRCIGAQHTCQAACPRGAISRSPVFSIDLERCDGCGECSRQCPAEALRMIGRRITAVDLLAEIMKDGIFFDQSRGGVTFTGGEPLSQPRFLAEMMCLCKKERIHVALDTCGHAPFEWIEPLLEMTDLFLYDVKFIDRERHARYTSVGNELILDNLGRIAAAGKALVIRIPLIPGMNDDDENMAAIAAHLKSLPQRPQVSLLNFHRGGEQKYRRLGIEYPCAGLQPLAAGRLNELRDFFSADGFSVTTGE